MIRRQLRAPAAIGIGTILVITAFVASGRPGGCQSPTNPKCEPRPSATVSPSPTLVTPSATTIPTPTPSATAPPSPSPTPVPTPSPSVAPSGTAYGTIASDGKANLEIGPWGDIGHRFRATTTSPAVSIRWPQRWGSGGYSGGNGGSIVVKIVPEVNGKPGTVPIAVTGPYARGNPGADTRFDLQTFSATGPLVAGNIYWAVFDNIDPSPAVNWISVNDLYAINAPAPRNPEQPDLAVWAYGKPDGTGWQSYSGGVSPVMDITMGDGTHAGIGFIETMVAQWAPINGAASVRQRFTPPAAHGPFTEIAMRATRSVGTGLLTLKLACNGTTLATGTSTVPVGIHVQHIATGWAKATVPAFTIPAGAACVFSATSPAGTSYEVVPLREGTNFGLLSREFPEGSAAERTADGSTWSPMYPDTTFAPTRLQFYFH